MIHAVPDGFIFPLTSKLRPGVPRILNCSIISLPPLSFKNTNCPPFVDMLSPTFFVNVLENMLQLPDELEILLAAPLTTLPIPKCHRLHSCGATEFTFSSEM